jgi:hypothetical protein
MMLVVEANRAINFPVIKLRENIRCQHDDTATSTGNLALAQAEARLRCAATFSLLRSTSTVSA